MIRDIIDWTKAYLITGFIAIPIAIMFSTPIIVLVDGQATRDGMFEMLIAGHVVSVVLWLLTIAGVLVKTCYKKVKERL